MAGSVLITGPIFTVLLSVCASSACLHCFESGSCFTSPIARSESQAESPEEAQLPPQGPCGVQILITGGLVFIFFFFFLSSISLAGSIFNRRTSLTRCYYVKLNLRHSPKNTSPFLENQFLWSKGKELLGKFYTWFHTLGRKAVAIMFDLNSTKQLG